MERLCIYSDLTVLQNGGLLSSWICWAQIWTTSNDYFVVSVVVQNLLGIDSVVSVNETFNILRVWLKNAYSRPQNWSCFLGGDSFPRFISVHGALEALRLSSSSWLTRSRLGP